MRLAINEFYSLIWKDYFLIWNSLNYSFFLFRFLVAEPCNPSNGWIHFSGSCYKFFAPHVTRQTADEQCHSVGAHLVTIDSASEQDFVSSTVLPRSKKIWLGLQRDLNSGTFIQWDDGSPVHFTDWDADSPKNQNSGVNCVVMRPLRGDYSWNDVRCTIEKDFVCEKGA